MVPTMNKQKKELSFKKLFSLNIKIAFLLWVFAAVHGLSLVVASRGYSLVAVCRPLISVVSLVAEHRL